MVEVWEFTRSIDVFIQLHICTLTVILAVLSGGRDHLSNKKLGPPRVRYFLEVCTSGGMYMAESDIAVCTHACLQISIVEIESTEYLYL